jgi:hypothetical protein
VVASATLDSGREVTDEEHFERMRAFAWKSKQLRELREIAALERMYSLQSPQRPRLTVSLVLDVALALFEVFAVLFEHAAVTLFPFHKLLDKFGGRPRKESK